MSTFKRNITTDNKSNGKDSIEKHKFTKYLIDNKNLRKNMFLIPQVWLNLKMMFVET